MSKIIISTNQLTLIQKAFSNAKMSKFSKVEKEEMEALIDCIEDIIQENDPDMLNDLELGSEI